MSRTLIIKTIALAVASVISALIYGIILRSFLNAGSWGLLGLLVAAIIIFMAAVLMQSFFINNFLISLAIFAADAIIIMAVFADKLSILMLLAGLGMIALFSSAYYGAKLELKNNLDIRFFKVSHGVMRAASSALAIFAIATYLSVLNLRDPQEAREALAVALKPIEPITAAYIPNFKSTDTLVSIASKIMPEDVRLSSQANQREFIAQSSARLSAVIAGYIKVAVSPNDSVLDIVYRATVAKLLKLSPTLQLISLLGVGFAAFFVIKFFLIFINWVAITLAFGIYQLLWSAEFFKISFESKTKKVIILDSEAKPQ